MLYSTKIISFCQAHYTPVLSFSTGLSCVCPSFAMVQKLTWVSTGHNSCSLKTPWFQRAIKKPCCERSSAKGLHGFPKGLKQKSPQGPAAELLRPWCPAQDGGSQQEVAAQPHYMDTSPAAESLGGIRDGEGSAMGCCQVGSHSTGSEAYLALLFLQYDGIAPVE